jgi:hypothetical protein
MNQIIQVAQYAQKSGKKVFFDNNDGTQLPGSIPVERRRSIPKQRGVAQKLGPVRP